ncbi:MAG: site-specific integrase, partial [Frankiaceae bacterium]
LTHEQVHALADACGGYRPLVLLLGYTGLRWGEATALRVRSVNLLRRRVAVAEAVVEIDGRLVYGTPKTHRRRSVPIPAFLVDDLAALCAGKGADDLVFTSPEGAALREGNFRRRCFDRAAVAVGLPNLHPHELRHAAASLAVDAGANVKHVQRLLGHKSAAMTLDVYADLFEDGLDELADRMNVAAYQTLADSTQTRRPPGAVRSLPPRREDAR